MLDGSLKGFAFSQLNEVDTKSWNVWSDGNLIMVQNCLTEVVSGPGNLSAEGTVPTHWNVLLLSSTELVSEMVYTKFASKA